MTTNSNFDEAKGRVKEAAGNLTGDKSLENEGKADRIGANVKDFAEKAKDKTGDAVDAVKDKFNKND